MWVISRGNYPIEVMPIGSTSQDAHARTRELQHEYCTRTKTNPSRVYFSYVDVPVTPDKADND